FTAAVAAAALAQETGVTLYEAKDFRGRSQTFFSDAPDLRGSIIGDDTASSVRVAPGCQAILYADPGFHGRSMAVTSDVSSLSGSSVGNDKVAALRVRCEGRIVVSGREYPRHEERREEGPPGVTLFRGTRFRGRYETFTQDVDNLRGSQFGNDAANSV